MEATESGRRLMWVLVAVTATANILGYTADLYHRWWWFDRVLHPSTILAMTFAAAVLILGPGLRNGHPIIMFVLIASVGLAIGALWEVVEWSFDRIAHGDNIKGKYDTIMDLIMDSVGATLAGALSLHYTRPKPRSDGGD
jgi:uncharacterized membrane protein YjdF